MYANYETTLVSFYLFVTTKMIRSRVNLAREVPRKAKAHLSKERRLIKEDSEFVFGTHSVKNALATRKRECRALYVQNADIHSEFEEFLNKLQYKIPIKSVNKEHLNQITACRPHNVRFLRIFVVHNPLRFYKTPKMHLCLYSH